MNRYQAQCDPYDEIGKYILDTLDLSKIPGLSFYANKLKKGKGIFTEVSDFIESRGQNSMVSIIFLTDTLGHDSLTKMFGEPIFHSEFGEGFGYPYDDEDSYEFDEEFDEEPITNESYASYFLNIKGINIHIGYDHRGTSLEIEKGTTYDQSIDVIKELVNIYKERCQS